MPTRQPSDQQRKRRSGRPYTRWTEDDKKLLWARRNEHWQMSNVEFTREFYPGIRPQYVGKLVNKMRKNPPTENQDSRIGIAATMSSSTTMTATNSLHSPQKRTASRCNDDDSSEEENSGAEESGLEDIISSGDLVPRKRSKSKHSTRSETSLDKPREPQRPSIVQSRMSGRQSLDKATPMSSPRLARDRIVTFAEHDNRFQTDGFNMNASLPPAPSVSPPPPPPPPPFFPPPSSPPACVPPFLLPSERPEKEQIPASNSKAQMDTTEKPSEQLQPQDQAGKSIVQQETTYSGEDLVRKFAELYKMSKTIHSQKQLCEKELLALQEKHNSVLADKDREILQLQDLVSQLRGDIDNFQAERETLINYKEKFERLRGNFRKMDIQDLLMSIQ